MSLYFKGTNFSNILFKHILDIITNILQIYCKYYIFFEFNLVVQKLFSKDP